MISRRLAIYALIIIFLANLLNYTDRQLVSALEEDISSELHLTPEEHGWLWSLFTIGYMLCAVPIGLLADRVNRPRLFAMCVVVWSLATIASGMATHKWELYVARVLIGIGEAGCLVIGPTLITDYFDHKARGRALSIFFLGLPLGGTAAFIMAGALRNVVTWREMFYVAGAPGFAIALLIWLLPDPPRGSDADAPVSAHGGHQKAGLKDYLQVLKTPTVMLIIIAQAFGTFMLIPLVHFGKEFFVASKGMTSQEAPIAIGLITLTAGVVGNLLSGFLGDRMARRMRGAYALLACLGYGLALPCMLWGIYAEARWAYLAAITGGALCLFFCIPAVNAQIANAVKSSQRGAAFALAVFILHLLGDTVSPPFFGSVNERFAGVEAHERGIDSDELRAAAGHAGAEGAKLQISYGPARQKAFAWFVIALIPASLCCFFAIWTARRDVTRIRAQTSS